MKVGLIGLGNMGSGMAANLLKAGHELTAYNRTPSKAQKLVQQGARSASQVAGACQGEAVITMLADDNAVESVVFDDAGVVSILRKGAIHISSSTISVALSEKMTAAHAANGQRFVSAPVFGRPDTAAAGRLFVAVAGEPDAVDDSMPLLEAIGQKTFRFGNNPSDATLVKLSGNFLISSVIEALGEAMALVGKAGLDQHQYVDFLTSTLFNAPVYKTVDYDSNPQYYGTINDCCCILLQIWYRRSCDGQNVINAVTSTRRHTRSMFATTPVTNKPHTSSATRLPKFHLAHAGKCNCSRVSSCELSTRAPAQFRRRM